LHKNPFEHIRGDRQAEACIFNALSAAGKASDPLEAEKILDQMKWDYVEELGQGHFFDIEFLICYGIKLSLIERYREIESGRGQEIFQAYKEEALNIK